MQFDEIKEVWKGQMKLHHIGCTKVSEAMGLSPSSFWLSLNERKTMFLHNLCSVNEVLGLALYIGDTKISSAQEALDWLFEAHKGKKKAHYHNRANCNLIWRWNNGRCAAMYAGFSEVVNELGYKMEVK